MIFLIEYLQKLDYQKKEFSKNIKFDIIALDSVSGEYDELIKPQELNQEHLYGILILNINNKWYPVLTNFTFNIIICEILPKDYCIKNSYYLQIIE